jgi:hypothetical protein
MRVARRRERRVFSGGNVFAIENASHSLRDVVDWITQKFRKRMKIGKFRYSFDLSGSCGPL